MSAIQNDDIKKESNTKKSPLLARITLPINQLIKDFPPDMQNRNKQYLYQLCMEGRKFADTDTSTFSRWRARQQPSTMSISSASAMKISYTEKVYQYETTDADTVAWYVNFADHHLFGYYGGNLFAQDEMQVGEHPICASFKEGLEEHQHMWGKEQKSPLPGTIEGDASECLPYTTNKLGATPCLIYHTPRLCIVNTYPSSTSPHGLYGNQFAHAKADQIKAGTTVLKPETWSHIVAMEAPKYGHGSYSFSCIRSIFDTAYSANMACREESYHQKGTTEKIHLVIHTGNWGCGAYGGNPTLMCLVQLIAAYAAQVDEIVYHTITSTQAYQDATDVLETWIKEEKDTTSINITNLLHKVESKQYKWGQSNGT